MLNAELLVEGKNDKHVVWALCEQYQVLENFSVEEPGEDKGGVDALLEGIAVRLKQSKLNALGIVLDADQDIESRWDAVCERLRQAGYSNLPDGPNPNGTIIESDQMPRVGIWIMPNNHLPGMLEDFVAELIPDDDDLKPKAEDILREIENENLNRYSSLHHQKAFIHTWLAWQETPGQPMGLAITAHALQHNQPLAQKFVDWLNRLFNA